MPSYYNIVEGNLHTGDIAKSSDINHMQIHVQDAFREFMSDLHDNESFILGSGEKHKNDFVITPAPKLSGRYIDDRIIFDIDETKYININRYDVKQPITLTKTSVYSIITKLKNSSNIPITVTCHLEDINGKPQRTNTITIPANTNTAKDFEIVFDLEHYPTAPNLTYEKLMERDGKDIERHSEEGSYDEGYTHDKDDEDEFPQFTAGVSQLFFVINKVNKDLETLSDEEKQQISFDADKSLGVYYTNSSPNAEKEIYCSIRSQNNYERQDSNIWFKEVYSNENTYLCTGGEAIIGGEKVRCIDSHVSISGGNAYGNVLSSIYLGLDGHLYARNSKVSLATDPNDFQEDLSQPIVGASLPIALILTYSSSSYSDEVNDIDKEPLIIQGQDFGQLPLSHHERIRRLEKYAKWIDDIVIPSRFKYTLTGEDWIDPNGAYIAGYPFGKKNAEDKEKNTNYHVTTDSNGNPVVRMSEAEVIEIPITLKETFKDKDGKEISLKEDDIANASYLSSKKNMVHDQKKGILSLDKEKKDSEKIGTGTTAKEAKLTEYNPWDDYKGNRPSSSKLSKKEREFKVISGKNGSNDFNSEYPAMTFYTDTNYKMQKLHIPIYKFQNCSAVKFYIWKRQSSNNQKNEVWLEKKIFGAKTFSLKKAKEKGKYQYMENGFTITFDNGGLSLPKGQYIIFCLPVPKSGEGSCFIETYKPQNPRDFLIRYYGAANASHFLLKERYFEIWYNSATATVVEENYYKTGNVTSKVITWTEEGLENIKKVKPVIDKNLTTPNKNCSWKIEVNTGGKWQEVTANEDNTVTGGANTFQWRLTFKTTDGKDTPILKYNSKSKYAIKFILTRNAENPSNTTSVEAKDKNMCMTSIPFDGDKILREYLGDQNFATVTTKFNQYEFARIWADPIMNKKLLIDIQGSDKDYTYKIDDTEHTTPLWSLHYCDLTLNDFSKINVDYSHYDEDVEYDENNLRLKLDPNHSYNDNDISITGINNFKKVANDIDSSESKTMTLVKKSSLTENQTLLKNTFSNTIDLTKYTGLKFKFKVEAQNADKVSGLCIYISNSEETTTPTDLTILDEAEEQGITILSDSQALVPKIEPGVSSESWYEGNIIEMYHQQTTADGNKAYPKTYYKYSQQFDNELNKYIYVLEQLHDFKSYKIYSIKDIEYLDSNTIEEKVQVKETDDNGETTTTEVTKKYVEVTARIEIDPNSQTLKYAKEIGIIASIDDEKYDVTSSNGVKITLKEVVGISEDYYPIFNPETENNLFTTNSEHVEIYQSKALEFGKQRYKKDYNAQTDGATGKVIEMKETSPLTTQICIQHQSINVEERDTLCYMNNTYEGGLSHYKHLGIQIATDVYIPKGCLKINLCEKENGTGIFKSINLPTLNTVYNPRGKDDTPNSKINLSQVFTKIDSDKEIKSISITATNKFREYMKDLIDTEEKGDYINLFLGKIVLYKAETIPMFHQKMRYKLYCTTNGEIDHTAAQTDSIVIRKLGTIIDYS